MTAWGLHCAHELHAPSSLLRQAEAAEAAGFDTVSCSDHFHPWTPDQGGCGHSWSWLGAAMERTRVPLGTIAAPGQRQHPALVAQAIATLGEMHPGRLWVALGTGENLNESITGADWPSPERRQERLLACVNVVRELLSGETVTSEGNGFTVRGARLWTLPRAPVPLLGAAMSPESARSSAPWADGLVTVRGAPEDMSAVIDAYRRRGGRGPVVLQAIHGWAATDREAVRLVHRQWPIAALEKEQLLDLATPADFAEACRAVTPEMVAERVPISSDVSRHLKWLAEYEEIGFDAVYILPVGGDPLAFIDAIGREVLPRLR